MGDAKVLKVADYIEADLDWEAQRCGELGADFACYKLDNEPGEVLVENLRDADFIVVNMAKINRAVMGGLARAKVIVRHGAGFDNLDLKAATENGILCAYQPNAWSEEVAEHAAMLMLAVDRNLRRQSAALEQSLTTGKWMFDRLQPYNALRSKTLGIVGCGNIGSHVLRKMNGFGMRILTCDPYLTTERWAELGMEHTPLEELLRQSDIVTIHVPVTDETRGLIDGDKIRLMKPSAVLVNTARGPLVDVGELAAALREGRLAGAGIDVYDPEPPDESYALLNMDNVILTPHLAWYSEQGLWDIRRWIMEDFEAFLDGGLPKHVLNREVLQSPRLRMTVRT